MRLNISGYSAREFKLRPADWLQFPSLALLCTDKVVSSSIVSVSKSDRFDRSTRGSLQNQSWMHLPSRLSSSVLSCDEKFDLAITPLLDTRSKQPIQNAWRQGRLLMILAYRSILRLANFSALIAIQATCQTHSNRWRVDQKTVRRAIPV